MPGRRDVHDVGALRIDDDARDRLRLAETHVREGLAAVRGLVDAVAERRRLSIVRLTRADPHDVGIRLINGDVADRRRAVLLEHGNEGRSGIHGLEHAADRVADPDDARILLVDSDVVDAAAHARRADGAEPKVGEQRIRRAVDHGAVSRRMTLPWAAI